MMLLEKPDLEYFEKGITENPKLWSRFGGEPSFEGLRVLDVGCGHGSLCVDIASKGAKKVIGVDINERLIKFANEIVFQRFPQLKNKIDFLCCDITDLREDEFNIIISKNSFEHIINLDKAFVAMKQKLKIEGMMYIGFGPLWNSPYGDHRRTKAIIPWGHLIFSESFLINRVNKHRQNKVFSLYDLGLNKLSLSEYKELFYNSGLTVLYFRANMSNNPISKLFTLLSRISFLEEYFTHQLYCILKK